MGENMKNNKKIIIILIIISVILILTLVGALAYITITKDSNKNKEIEDKVQKNEVLDEDKNEQEDIVEDNGENETEENITEDNTEEENPVISMEALTFNLQFTSYQGEVNEQMLQGLLNKAVSSNEQNLEHRITVTSDNLDSLNNLDKDATYTISFEYDAKGYINVIKINKKEEINILDTSIEIQNGLLNSATDAADNYREQLEEEESLGPIKINGVEVNF